MRGILGQQAVGWCLLTVCAGCCCPTVPQGNSAGVLDVAPVPDGEVCSILAGDDGVPCPPDAAVTGKRRTCLKCFLCRLFHPLHCVRRVRGTRGRDPAAGVDYHDYSRFHPVPTRPVFALRPDPLLAMEDRVYPPGLPGPVPGQSVPGKSASPYRVPSPDAMEPPARLETIPTPPADPVHGRQTAVPKQLDAASAGEVEEPSWVFNPPVPRDPESSPKTAQVRRSVKLDRATRATR